MNRKEDGAEELLPNIGWYIEFLKKKSMWIYFLLMAITKINNSRSIRMQSKQYRVIRLTTLLSSIGYRRRSQAVESTYEQAMKQLSATYHLFIDKERAVGINLMDKRGLLAHVCTSARFPRLTSSQIGYAIDFALQEHIPLTFGNTITK